MKLMSSFDISASALTAQRLRMDVISSNIANAETTRGSFVNGEWVPYQRKLVVLEPQQQRSFADTLSSVEQKGQGVKVSRITEDSSSPKLMFDPDHPDANEQGYVRLPNVDILKEMVDMIGAIRSYEANVTAFNASKAIVRKALEIGKS